MEKPLEKGPMEQVENKAQEMPDELPELDKPYEDMTPEELRDRAVLERKFSLKAAGCPVGQLDNWKETHGRIGTLAVGERVFVYRPLRRIEKRKLVQKAMHSREEWRREIDFEEEVVAMCVVWPRMDLQTLRNEEYDGVVSELSNAIQGLSGHGSSAYIIEL